MQVLTCRLTDRRKAKRQGASVSSGESLADFGILTIIFVSVTVTVTANFERHGIIVLMLF